MLALWPDSIFVIISPSHIVVLHTRRKLFKRIVIAENKVDLTVAENNSQDASRIIETLTKVLSKLTIQRGNLDVILSNHFVHMELLPPLDKALKPEEQRKRVQLHFDRIYGVVAKKWCFSSNTVKFQQPTLVAAIDQSLLSELQKLAGSLNLKLVSVEPSLMLMLNHWKKRLNGALVKFISLEKACWNILNLQNLKITSLSQSRYTNQFTSEDFLTVIQREALKNGETLQGKELYLFSPRNPNLTLEASGAKLQHLRLPVTKSATEFTESRVLKLLGEM